MKKLTKQELAKTNENKVISEIEKIAKTEFDYQTPTSFQVFLMNPWTIWISLITGFLLILPLIIFVLGVRLESKYKRIVNSQMQGKQNQIYKLWFEKNYDDTKLEIGVNKALFTEIANKNRGAGIPRDAKVCEYLEGYKSISNNGAVIEMVVMNWKWTRNYGKSSSTYYKKRAYYIIRGFKDSFKELNLELSKNGILNKARKELENELFNKSWIYKHNDPVKLRMLFTPSVQEDLLENMKNSTFEMYKFDDKQDLFFASQEIKQSDSTFKMNTRGRIDYRDKEKIIEKFISDVISDIEIYQQWLKDIFIFRTLFKTV